MQVKLPTLSFRSFCPDLIFDPSDQTLDILSDGPRIDASLDLPGVSRNLQASSFEYYYIIIAAARVPEVQSYHSVHHGGTTFGMHLEPGCANPPLQI